MDDIERKAPEIMQWKDLLKQVENFKWQRRLAFS